MSVVKIRTVAVLGAGAVGSYFIWGLEEKLGESLWVVADGDRQSRLAREGLVINGRKYKLNLRTPQEAHGADLLLVATKYGALKDALDDIAAIADEHTIVMSLLNGVDSEEIIAARIGGEKVLPCFIKIPSERRGNEIRFDWKATLGVYFGEAQSDASDVRVRAVADLLDGTKLRGHAVPDIMRQLWLKFALNVSNNLPQAILGCGIGAFWDSSYAAHLADCLADEVVALAAAKGIDISDGDPTGRKTPVAKQARYSTLQDLDAHRHTEVDLFAGTVMRLGKELGIPTPYNDFAFHAIKALEEKNDGKFDY